MRTQTAVVLNTVASVMREREKRMCDQYNWASGSDIYIYVLSKRVLDQITLTAMHHYNTVPCSQTPPLVILFPESCVLRETTQLSRPSVCKFSVNN